MKKSKRHFKFMTLSRLLSTMATISIIFNLLAPSSFAENYRQKGHEVGDLSVAEKSNIFFSSTASGVLGLVGVGLFGAVASTGIGTAAAAGTILVGSTFYKFKKSLEAKPYYKMARIMEYARANSDATVSPRSKRDFLNFVAKLPDDSLKENPEQVKEALIILSKEGMLDHHPHKRAVYELMSQKLIAEYIHGAIKGTYENSLREIMTMMEKEQNPFASSHDLLLKWDSFISAMKDFRFHPKFQDRLNNPYRFRPLLAQAEVILLKFHQDPESFTPQLQNMEKFYGALLDRKISLVSPVINADQKNRLIFEQALYSLFEQQLEGNRHDVDEDSGQCPGHLSEDELRPRDVTRKLSLAKTLKPKDQICLICQEVRTMNHSQCPTCKNEFCDDCIAGLKRANTKNIRPPACPLRCPNQGNGVDDFTIKKIPLPWVIRQMSRTTRPMEGI